ncbi:hypothetical protein [Actinoplanes sp. URMC 104]|uniref:hypothetical protein n=1 Tax=Actinoplanes sp. URMC 104 TaxID=3423409 RepID=UPI003F1A13A8
MKLSDLLETVRDDAPPARYTVDDFVAAGRRRKRLRNAGWGAVAVVAVVAAIGVPQTLTRRASEPAVVPAPVPSAGSPSVAEHTFTGYTAGPFRVLDPETWRLDGETTVIERDGVPVGVLDVLHPGVDPYGSTVSNFERTDTDPVNGRPAYVRRGTDQPNIVDLVWEYADGALASVRTSGKMSPADMRMVAEGFSLAPPRAVRTPLSTSFLPQSYHLVQASADAVQAYAYFQLDDEIRMRLGEPDYSDPLVPPATHAPRGFIGLQLLPRDRTALRPATDQPVCKRTAGFELCVRRVAADRFVQVSGGDYLTRAQVLRILGGVTVADVADPSAWRPVGEAFPATAQPLK